MSLSVLTDEQIRLLLESLTVEELESFILNLKGALHDYSNGSQGGEAEIHQPHRQAVNSSRTGATTLFMPSSSPAGVGVKGVHPPVLSCPAPSLAHVIALDLALAPGLASNSSAPADQTR